MLVRTFVLGFALALTGCSKAPDPSSAPARTAGKIEWVDPAATPIDAVFARARTENKPVFLFWSAAWCPPCNHVKSTVFTREEFIRKSRAFIPVYVDGDSAGGQALGRRFKVSGYPTMVLLNADGAELTRLAGSVEPARYMQLLDYGVAATTTAKEALAVALAGKPLDPDQWRLLAYHAWETDERQLVAQDEAPSVLMKLATACPPAERESASRLVLQAVAAAAQAKPGALRAFDKADARASVASVLKQPDLVREHVDLIASAGDDIVGFLTEPRSPERTALMAQWLQALEQLSADPTLGTAARVWVTSGKVNLARLDHKGPLPAALLDEVREVAARADREATAADERQSVITSAGGMLSRAGLFDDAAALMKAELPRSHSPYYYMLGLAVNERRRGTPAGNLAALDWAAQAYQTAKGPATRIEWGASYLRYLVELAPDDAERIEQVAIQVAREMPAQPGAFAGRSQRVLERTSGRLVKWSDGRYDERLRRINAAFAPLCDQAAETAERAGCQTLFLPNGRG